MIVWHLLWQVGRLVFLSMQSSRIQRAMLSEAQPWQCLKTYMRHSVHTTSNT